jgi:hypothetical protein
MSDYAFMDPCVCGHSFEAHGNGKDGGPCNALDCEGCAEYLPDTSWTDEMDEQDYLDEEDSI